MPRHSLVAVVLLAACGSTAPNRVSSLVFESTVLAGIPTLPTSAVPTPGMIEITGVIPTIGTGFRLSGKVTLTRANQLTLVIDAYDNAPGAPFPAQNLYKARLGQLAPGDYDVSVIHDVHEPAPGVRERVFHPTVHVN